MQGKICHITTAHPAFDKRIFFKECISLAEAGFEVHLLVANQADKVGKKDGVWVHNIELSKSRIPRFLFSKNKVIQKALAIDASVYHFHDPELLQIVKALKQQGKRVIYDSHEDVPRQILFKSYIPKFLRHPISSLYEKMENRIVQKLDAVVSPTPHIQKRFAQLHARSVSVCNFPKKSQQQSIAWESRQTELCYVGTLMRVRGIREMVVALEKIDARLNLAGNWWEEDYRLHTMQLPGWKKVNALGYLSTEEVNAVLQRSKIGLVTLHPIESYQVAYAVKMFEYMAAGIPFVASNFPLWKEIVESSQCGICVDPLDTDAIAEAVNYLLQNEEAARQMGINGQKAFMENYHWQGQKEKLVQLYQQLITTTTSSPKTIS